MEELLKGVDISLIGIETNQGGVGMPGLEKTDPNYWVTRDGEVCDYNVAGFFIPFSENWDVMVSFVGYKSKQLIGRFCREGLEVLPGIAVNIITIKRRQIPSSYQVIPDRGSYLSLRDFLGRAGRTCTRSTEELRIPNSYKAISDTGIYIDTNKVDIQYSYSREIDGVVHKKVISLFPGPKVETIRDGVCRMCLQKTDHTGHECPGRDLGMASDRNSGPSELIPIIPKPLCKENALDNGVRFNLAPEKADENELRAIFEEYGKVKKLYLNKHKQTGVSNRFGFVKFFNIDDAERALDALKDQFMMHWFVV